MPARADNFLTVDTDMVPFLRLVAEKSDYFLISLRSRPFVVGKDSIANLNFFNGLEALFRFNKRTLFEALEALYDIACRNRDSRERETCYNRPPLPLLRTIPKGRTPVSLLQLADAEQHPVLILISPRFKRAVIIKI